jgi:hypothetical protein
MVDSPIGFDGPGRERRESSMKAITRIAAAAALTATSAACEYDPSAVSPALPQFSQCNGQTADFGFGWLQQLDPPTGSTHDATNGIDTILTPSGPVAVNGLDGDDTICVRSAVGNGPNPTVTLRGGNGSDTAYLEDGDALFVVCDSIETVIANGQRAACDRTTVTFTSTNDATVGDNSFAVVIVDVDGDGDGDVITGNANVGRTPDGAPNRVYFNDGSGSFTDSGQALGTDFTKSVATADIDGDGDADLITGNIRGPNRVYFNDGTGTYADSGQALGTGTTAAVALADIDGDGDADLITGNIGLTGGIGEANRVYFNDGNGAYTDSGQALGTGNTQSVATADIDGDGDADIITGAANSQPNRVYVNDGNGAYTDSGQALGTGNTQSVATADIDGDGDADVIAGNAGESTSVHLNDGAGTYTDGGQIPRVDNTASIAVADIDGDGDPDIIAGNIFEQNRVYLRN